MNQSRNALTTIGGVAVGAIIAGLVGALMGFVVFRAFYYYEGVPPTSDTGGQLAEGIGAAVLNLWNFAACTLLGGVIGAVVGAIAGAVLTGRPARVRGTAVPSAQSLPTPRHDQ